MGPYALAGELERHGISTLVIDNFSTHPDFFNWFERYLHDGVRVVGLSSTFLSPPLSFSIDQLGLRKRADGSKTFSMPFLWFYKAEDLQHWLKTLKALMQRKCPKAVLILGGAKAARIFENVDVYRALDYAVIGAAENALVQVVKALRKGEKPLADSSYGISAIANAGMYEQGKVCNETIWLKKWGVQRNESLPIEVSRGCVFSCKFCNYDKKESFRKNLETLRAEFIRNYEQFGTSFYHFCDDCFNDHPEKVRAICSLILTLPFKLEWVSYARTDVAVKFPDTAELMVKAGARGLLWGLESFNYEVARRAGKGTPTEKVKEFLLRFKAEYGSEVIQCGSFIVGLPGETEDSMKQTIDWLAQHHAVDIALPGVLEIIPFNSRLDKIRTDYADYSRNPEKYGFEDISFRPPYWRHATMDMHKANELTDLFVQTMSRDRPAGLIRNIFNMPHLRTLGLGWPEIRSVFLDPNQREWWLSDEGGGLKRRNETYLRNYFASLDREYVQAMESPQQLAVSEQGGQVLQL